MKRIHLLVGVGFCIGIGAPIAMTLAATFGGPPNCTTPPCNNVPGVIWNVAGTSVAQPNAQADFTGTDWSLSPTVKSDFGLSNGKAFRIDATPSSTYWMGNWYGGSSKPFTYSINGDLKAFGFGGYTVPGETGTMYANQFCFHNNNCISSSWSGGAGSYVLKAGDSMTGGLSILQNTFSGDLTGQTFNQLNTQIAGNAGTLFGVFRGVLATASAPNAININSTVNGVTGSAFNNAGGTISRNIGVTGQASVLTGSTAQTNIGGEFVASTNNTANVSVSNVGVLGQYNANNTIAGSVIEGTGVFGNAYNFNAGNINIPNLRGVRAYVDGRGTNVYGVDSTVYSRSTVTNAYGVNSLVTASSGTIPTAYGVKAVVTRSAPGNITNAYGVHADASAIINGTGVYGTGNLAGIRGYNASNPGDLGYGVFGEAWSTVGVYGSTIGGGGIGVKGTTVGIGGVGGSFEGSTGIYATGTTNGILSDGTIRVSSAPQWSSWNYGADFIAAGSRNNAIGILDYSGNYPWAIVNNSGDLGFARMPPLGDKVTAPNVVMTIASTSQVGIGVIPTYQKLRVSAQNESYTATFENQQPNGIALQAITYGNGNAFAIRAQATSSQIAAIAAIGYKKGIFGESSADYGNAIHGQALGLGATGVRGYVQGNNSVGVLGEMSGSAYGFGVIGRSTQTVNAVGVQGDVSTAFGTSYAGQFIGQNNTNLVSLGGPSFAIMAQGDVTVTTTKGILLNSTDRPLITRGFDAFTAGTYNGIGRWGLFMEPSFLTLGFPNISGRGVKISSYNADSSYTTLLTVSSTGLYLNSANALKNGGGSWLTWSDARLKNISSQFTRGLADLSKIDTVRFKFKPNNALGIPTDGEKIGVIAQEVQKSIPEAVSIGSDGYLVVNNDPIIWTMLNSIKELKAQNDDLRARIEALEAK